MSEKEIIKKFLNEKNGQMYSSLKTAKESTKSPYISRVWIKDEKNNWQASCVCIWRRMLYS